MMQYVLAGAAIGALLRLLFAALVEPLPIAQAQLVSLFLVNALGCFAFAFTAGATKNLTARAFWLTGCWGSYTSFSAVAAVAVLAGTSSQFVAFWLFASVSAWWLSFRMGAYMAAKIFAKVSDA